MCKFGTVGIIEILKSFLLSLAYILQKQLHCYGSPCIVMEAIALL